MTQIGHIDPLASIADRCDNPRSAGPQANAPIGGWSTPLKKEEFASFEAGQSRFEEALHWGYVKSRDRVRFLTLWRWVARFSSDDDSKRPAGSYKIENPGGFFTSALKKGNWLGSEDDEAKIKELLSRHDPGSTKQLDPYR